MDPEEKDKAGENTPGPGDETNTGANAPASSAAGAADQAQILPAASGEVTPPEPSDKGSGSKKNGAASKDTASKQPKAEDKPASGKSAQRLEAAKQELSIMDKVKVDKLFKNTKGEYFTTENLAHLSEPKKENIKQITRSELELIVNAAE